MVEEPPSLGLAQLSGEKRADVDGAVEVHVADDVPGDALVDGDVAVRLGTDEVRAPQSPDDDAGGTGSGGWYRVYGYAAFTLKGYAFTGQFKSSPAPCNGNVRCISGYFTRFVELSDVWKYSPDAPQLGSSILRLIR